jgi:hypothetical protein
MVLSSARCNLPDNCQVSHSVQTGSGIHSASYPVGTGDSLPVDNAAGA